MLLLRRPLSSRAGAGAARAVRVSELKRTKLQPVNSVYTPSANEGDRVELRGWVRSVRKQKNVSFLELNDGSSATNLQVVGGAGAMNAVATGASVRVRGTLAKAHLNKRQAAAAAQAREEAAAAALADGGSCPPPPALGTMFELHLDEDEGEGAAAAAAGGEGGAARGTAGGSAAPGGGSAGALQVLGDCDPLTYPLQKKAHSPAFLREILHLRPRASRFGAVMRVRGGASKLVHDFFEEEGFTHVHTPILTASDAEGAGELFAVEAAPPPLPPPPTPEEEAAAAAALRQRAEMEEALRELRAEHGLAGNPLPPLPATAASAATAASSSSSSSSSSDEQAAHFFGGPAFLTVSGQLQAEMFACALGRVYTFGPTFRAENSNTSRHLAEFWMVEPEAAFAGAEENMDLAEGCVKHVLAGLLGGRRREDLEVCATANANAAAEAAAAAAAAAAPGSAKAPPAPPAADVTGLLRMLERVADSGKPFARMSYTEAVDVLARSGRAFEHAAPWGANLQSEHERYLAEEHCGCPVFVTDYPASIKPFYMRQSGDGDGSDVDWEDPRRTVGAMDLLVPGLGELIGGSVREERLGRLEHAMRAQGLLGGLHGGSGSDGAGGGGAAGDSMQWYLDLRRYGTVPHAGWGMGFDRLVQFATGTPNIRDVCPVPRFPQYCKF